MSATGRRTDRASAKTRSSQRTRRRKRTLHPLAIAAIVIFATVFITFYAFNQGLPFVHQYTLYALVNNSVNVRSGSPVRIAGIDVGSVEAVSPAGNSSRIAFTVSNDGLPVHRDATVRIRDRLFLEGGYYLELDPGSPSAPTLHDGDTIPESQTSSPVQFYNVLSMFDTATRSNVTNLVSTLDHGFAPRPNGKLSDSGAGGLKSSIPELTPTLKDVAWISQALRGTHQGDVARLLSSSSQVTSTLASNSAQLTGLVVGLDRVSSALVASDGALAQSVSGLDQTLRVAPGALSAIDRALPPLGRLATILTPSLKVAPPILTQLTSTVRQLGKVVAPAERRQLLTSLNATFQQFPVILHQLAVTFPITKQVTDCLRTHVLPVVKSQVPDGSLSTGRAVWQDFVHFLPGLSGASGGFDANGPYTRVLAGAGSNSLGTGQLGSLPGIGQLVGAPPPGGGSVLGARPSWVGDLIPSDFRPDQPCASQPVPSLAAPAVAADLHSRRTPSSKALTLPELGAAIAAINARNARGATR